MALFFVLVLSATLGVGLICGDGKSRGKQPGLNPAEYSYGFGYPEIQHGILLHTSWLKDAGNGLGEIPKTLIQTYRKKEKVPDYVYEQARKFAPEYRHLVWDDTEVIQFLKEHFAPEVLQAFRSLKRGAHKADLFRYCYLYRFGGVYLDADQMMTRNLTEVFTPPSDYFTTISWDKSGCMQGILAAPPGHPLFPPLIASILKHAPCPNNRVCNYLTFTIDMKEAIEKEIGFDEIEAGSHAGPGGNRNYTLWREHCTQGDAACEAKGKKGDKYGWCCEILDTNGTAMFGGRWPDYPWK